MSDEIEKLKMHSPDLTAQNVDRIAALFPGCVTEIRGPDGTLRRAVDFDLLRQEFSDSIVEGSQERYHLDWPGKRQALITANAPIAKTLRPVRADSVDFDTTRNLFIEGDNLEALKLLQETYLGKVKMIYIDPPYNTGNDFVYEDDFVESTAEFLAKSNQVDEAGNRLVANTQSNGRFHSDWLSMMYPRLKIAFNLLHDEGVVFISIDDNEVGNLINLCNEIFGSDNFIGSISWSKKRKGSFLSKTIVSVTEWLLVYGKTKSVRLFGGKADENESQPLIKRTNPRSVLLFPEYCIDTKLQDGIYASGIYGEGTSAVNVLEPFEVGDGKITTRLKVEGNFIWSQDYLDAQIKGGARLIVNTANIQVRAFKTPDENSFKGILSLINGVEISATNEDGYEELTKLLGSEGVMSYPKPLNYIKHLVLAQSHWDKSSVVLDFFAGSSTTAHAVLSANAADGGERRFVMVQLPEVTDKDSRSAQAGFSTIAEISKERIRRAGKKILEGDCHPDWNRDVGFRVLRIDSSNMADVYYTPDATTQADLLTRVDNIKPGRTAEDLLFQVLLDWGVDLTLPITRESLDGKTVFTVAGTALIACFDNGVDEALVKTLATLKPLRVVFKDTGFKDDATKINVKQIFKSLSPDTDVKAI